MAAAKPVVATRVGGCPEVVANGQTGYIIEPRDRKALVDRLLSLLNNPGLAEQMGREGQRLVRRKFSVEQMVQSTSELYRQVLCSSN